MWSGVGVIQWQTHQKAEKFLNNIRLSYGISALQTLIEISSKSGTSAPSSLSERVS
jgi:hypothetical protein